MEHQTHRLVVPRSARFVTAGELDSDITDVWLLCHGYGQLASEFLDQAKALEQQGRLLVAPEALSRFYHEDHQRIGASWMTREDRDHEMEDYVRYLDLVHDHVFAVVRRSNVKTTLLGFSQGAATAARWAALGKSKIDHLILWGSPLPPELNDDSSLEPLRRLRLTLVGGSRDEFLAAKEWEDQRSRLRAHGVVFEERVFEGGHRLDDETLRALAND